VARHGAVLNPVQPHPDVIGRNLVEVAELILEREVAAT
jgi:hypothetical protein